jgi:hypothetical protein
MTVWMAGAAPEPHDQARPELHASAACNTAWALGAMFYALEHQHCLRSLDQRRCHNRENATNS